MVAGVVGTWCQGQKKSPQRNSKTEMHRQMHRTDVVPELAGRQSMSLVARSKNSSYPVPEHLMLICHRIDLPTSPRACSARWLVQYLDFQTIRLDDQSPSMQCSVVGAVPRSPNWQTGRPVPEHTVLGGRCSPQISKLADWTTSPPAYSARWSVQSPDL